MESAFWTTTWTWGFIMKIGTWVVVYWRTSEGEGDRRVLSAGFLPRSMPWAWLALHLIVPCIYFCSHVKELQGREISPADSCGREELPSGHCRSELCGNRGLALVGAGLPVEPDLWFSPWWGSPSLKYLLLRAARPGALGTFDVV